MRKCYILKITEWYENPGIVAVYTDLEKAKADRDALKRGETVHGWTYRPAIHSNVEIDDETPLIGE